MLRFIRYGFSGVFALMAAAMLSIGVAQGHPLQAALPAAMLFVVGAAVWLGFGYQIRRVAMQGDAVRAAVTEVSATLFDAPAAVRPGYDMTVTSGRAGAALNAMETDAGFTAEGTFGDARVGVASHVSTLGRQVGELTHTYSYVVVDARGLDVPFRLTKQGAFDEVVQLATGDVTVGDEAFDAEWSITADPTLARAALDDSVRERLTALRARVPSVSQDVGPGTMSVVLTRHGLAIRWPGPLDVELATFMRDLLLDMRRAILTHVDREALRAASAGGPHYRVAADPTAPPPSAELATLEDDDAEDADADAGRRRAQR